MIRCEHTGPDGQCSKEAVHRVELANGTVNGFLFEDPPGWKQAWYFMCPEHALASAQETTVIVSFINAPTVSDSEAVAALKHAFKHAHFTEDQQAREKLAFALRGTILRDGRTLYSHAVPAMRTDGKPQTVRVYFVMRGVKAHCYDRILREQWEDGRQWSHKAEGFARQLDQEASSPREGPDPYEDGDPWTSPSLWPEFQAVVEYANRVDPG